MERHHEAALLHTLDQLYLEGAVSIPKERLYLWFDQQRLTKGVYRELVTRWEDLCTVTYHWDVAPELFVLHFDTPMLNLRRERFDGEELVPLSEWSGSAQPKLRDGRKTQSAQNQSTTKQSARSQLVEQKVKTAKVEWSNGTFGTIKRPRFVGENTLLMDVSQDLLIYSLRLSNEGGEFAGLWECNDANRSHDSARLTLERDKSNTYSFTGTWIEQGEKLEWWANNLVIENIDDEQE
jgi:hypothetical protein